jgi:hypothetical protein
MLEYESGVWNYYMRRHKGKLSMLQRPKGGKQERTKLCFGRPPLDVLTGAYDDVLKTLNTIQQYVISELGMKLAFVWGDQQSYSRMVSLTISGEKAFQWLVPCPGEFHFIVHALMAVHHQDSGWWAWFLGWVTKEAADDDELSGGGFMSDQIGDKWDSVEKYNGYCAFHEALSCAVLEYLQEVLPADLKYNVYELLDVLEAHDALGTPSPCP